MNLLRWEREQNRARVIVVEGDRSFTCSDISHRADEWAAVFRRNRINRVLIQSDDPCDLIAALIACDEEGVDLFVAHNNLSPDRTEQIVEECGVRMILPSMVISGREDKGDKEEKRIEEIETERQGKVVLMTSGTTGAPKLVKHTLNALLGRILPSASLASNREGRWLMTYQPTSFAGMQVILTACLTGGTIVQPLERTAAAFYEAAKVHRVTHISGTPTFWRSFLLVGRPALLSELRQITIGGEAIDQTILNRLSTAFPQARLSHMYASTEAGALFAVHDGRHGFPARWLEEGIQGVKLRICEDQLEVLSPHRMVGYAAKIGLPTTPDGWLMTGDRVRVEGDRILFMGRNDAMINVGGTKIFPHEIEAVLLAMPEIAEARVIGVPNPISGQVTVAEIVVMAGAEGEKVRQAVMKRCREVFAPERAPRVIRLVSSIPVHLSGKKA